MAASEAAAAAAADVEAAQDAALKEALEADGDGAGEGDVDGDDLLAGVATLSLTEEPEADTPSRACHACVTRAHKHAYSLTPFSIRLCFVSDVQQASNCSRFFSVFQSVSTASLLTRWIYCYVS